MLQVFACIPQLLIKYIFFRFQHTVYSEIVVLESVQEKELSPYYRLLFCSICCNRWESKGPGPKGPEPKGPESKGPRSIRWTDHVSTQLTIGTSEHSFKSVYKGR